MIMFFINCDTLSILMAVLTGYTALLCFGFELSGMLYDMVWRCTLGSVFLLTFLAFLVNDFLLFYIGFEFIICPMFFIIFIFGSRGRKLHAAYMFFFYTFVSSVLLLIVFTFILFCESDLRFLVSDLDFEFVCFILAFLGFAAKVPIYPMHIWLPEAHVEAPMLGSVLLASLLLKLGGYGIVRIVANTSVIVVDFCYFICVLICIVSAIYAGIIAVRSIDTKKIIAYSSISHMNVSLVALFSNSLIGYVGLIYSFISHALIASILFLFAGLLYERSGTRNLFYYGGFFLNRPLIATVFLVSLLANLGFPFFCHFIAEVLVYISVSFFGILTALFLSFSFIVVAIFVFGILVRVLYNGVGFWSYVRSFELVELTGIVGNLVGVIVLGLAPLLLIDLILWSNADYEMGCNLVLWNLRAFMLSPVILYSILYALIAVFVIACIGFLIINLNLIYMLICIEVVFMAVNASFVFISLLYCDMIGQIVFFYILVVSACEVAVFLTLILLLYFKFGCISVDLLRELKWV